MKGFEIYPQTAGTAKGPGDAQTEKGEFFPSGFVPPEGVTNLNMQLTYALWENFLKHVAEGDQGTLSTPELGAAAFSTVNMGVQSYRNGKVLFWDKEAPQADAWRRFMVQELGGSQQEARQAESDHRLARWRRRQRLQLRRRSALEGHERIHEARRPLGERQRPRRSVTEIAHAHSCGLPVVPKPTQRSRCAGGEGVQLPEVRSRDDAPSESG